MTDQQLRDRIAQAIASVPITIGPNSLALLKDGHTLGLTSGEIDAMALSALAAIQPELDRLHAELATARRGRETATGQLLHFAAEAHRRKWAYDNGDEGPTPDAFAALHQLGNEMRAAANALTTAPSAPTT